MTYIDPKTVDSPRKIWELTEVVINTGQGGWSLAEGTWDKKPCLAMRWNGTDSDEGVGNPQSRGHPTWFIIPDEMEHMLRKETAQLKQAIDVVACTVEAGNSGAWRIEASLSEKIRKQLGQGELQFSLPVFEKRLCKPDDKYIHFRDKGEMQGRFIKGRFSGYLYSYVNEDESPTNAETVRDALKQNIIRAVKQYGLEG